MNRPSVTRVVTESGVRDYSFTAAGGGRDGGAAAGGGGGASKILHRKELYTFRNGELLIPQSPGLGLDLDEDAIEHYRVRRGLDGRGQFYCVGQARRQASLGESLCTRSSL